MITNPRTDEAPTAGAPHPTTAAPAFLTDAPARRLGHRRLAYTIALALHVVLLVVLLRPHRPVALHVGPSSSGSRIAAFVGGGGTPTGTTGTLKAEEPKVQVKKTPLPSKRPSTQPSVVAEAPAQSADGGGGLGAGAGGAQGGGQGGPGGLARLGPGLQLLKQVKPIYPRAMEVQRVPGTVVLEAVIFHDGSVGDVKVLSSTARPFEQAAVEAVKQWRYAPIPYDGVLTVTVNFTLQ